ncbi:MAG: lysozyme inhibitor LprI family protein [Pseudomonadota bacterium]
MRLTVFLAAFSVPALAQPDASVVAALDTCVRSALPDMTAAETCTGHHFALCQTEDERQRWEGALRCQREMGAAWDALLAQTWPAALDWARQTDAFTANQSDPAPSAEDALRAAWPAWAAWRDAECALQGLAWPSDPLMIEMARTGCWHHLTASRVIDLYAMIRGPE